MFKRDPLLDKVTDFAVYGNSNTTSDFIALPAGEYYIQITDGMYQSELTYSISVNIQHDHVGVWAVTTPPTCISSGTETKICTVCGHAETREVPITEHIRDGGKIVKKRRFFKVVKLNTLAPFAEKRK